MRKTGSTGNTPNSPNRTGQGAAAAKPRTIELEAPLSVRQLAELLETSAIDVIKQLMRNGIMATINQVVDYETAAAIVTSFGHQPKPKSTRNISSAIAEMRKAHSLQDEKNRNLKPRPPVVTIMGHVDHGKTRLLDAIRQTNVMAGEAGGITQHIGAYQVEVNGQKVTFLDTPGHEAFTAMRARGAQVTDIVILVVAADDGVMPQTREAIDHAQAAGVPIVVAINKIDKAGANPDTTKQQLAEAGLVVEEWGGDVIAVPISAKERTGIEDLLENLLLVAEMEDLRADPTRPASGVVIEAEMDKSRGPLSTALIHDGTLRVSDTIVVGTTWGRIKAMFNDFGKQIRKAEPSTPVEILGLSTVPQVGDILKVATSEAQAQKMIQKRRDELQAARAINLTNLRDQISVGQVKDLNIIIKADVQGSIEPIRSSLQDLSTDEVQVRIIRSGTGNVTESDVMLAIASRAIIIGFGVGTQQGAQQMAEREDISIRNYKVIYELVNDVSSALQGMLEPTYVEVIEGRAEVRDVFSLPRKEKVAGVYVTEGKVNRNVSLRVIREQEVITETTISSLKRFKDDVREVASGYECGIGAKDFNDFKVGDILEFFSKEIKR